MSTRPKNRFWTGLTILGLAWIVMLGWSGAVWAGSAAHPDSGNGPRVGAIPSASLQLQGVISPTSSLENSASANQAGWEWQNTVAEGRTLFDVWGSSGSDVFAVGDGGAILHYDGSSWSPMNSGTTTKRLWGVWGNAPDDVFAVGDSGLILHYDGTGWTLMENSKFRFYGVWGNSAGDVWAVGQYGAILHYPAPASKRVFLPLVVRQSP